jgi:hypothetical protein
MPTLPVPAIAAANTLLYLGTDASPSVFGSPIARLGGIKVVTKVGVVDVSNQNSVARRKLATLIDNGPLTADYYWEPEQVQDFTLFSLITAAPPVLRSWQLVWPDGRTWLFAAYLTNFSPDAPIAGALKVAFELTIDGQIIEQ